MASGGEDLSMGTFAATMAGLVMAGGVVMWLGLRADKAAEPPAARPQPVVLVADVEPASEPPPADGAPEAEQGPVATIQNAQVVLESVTPEAAPDAEGEPEPVLRLMVLDAFGDEVAAYDPAELERVVRGFHDDPARRECWLDLQDGRRVELDPSSVAKVREALPTRFTYDRDPE